MVQRCCVIRLESQLTLNLRFLGIAERTHYNGTESHRRFYLQFSINHTDSRYSIVPDANSAFCQIWPNTGDKHRNINILHLDDMCQLAVPYGTNQIQEFIKRSWLCVPRSSYFCRDSHFNIVSSQYVC